MSASYKFNTIIAENLRRMYGYSAYYQLSTQTIWIESYKLFIGIYKCDDQRVKIICTEQFSRNYCDKTNGTYIIKNNDIDRFIHGIIVKTIDMSLIYNYVPQRLTQEYGARLYDIDIIFAKKLD